MTGQLSIVSALPSSQSGKTPEKSNTHPPQTPPALELISEDEEPHTDAAGSAFTVLLHSSPQYYLYSAVTHASHMSKTRDTHNPKVFAHS